jgi:hypothetical protein
MTRVRKNKIIKTKDRKESHEKRHKKEKKSKKKTKTICKLPFLVMHPKKGTFVPENPTRPLRDALMGMFVSSSSSYALYPNLRMLGKAASFPPTTQISSIVES